MDNNYHVLWIDDEWDKMTSFITSCELRYQMVLHPFKTQKEGLDEYAMHSDFYEAVILDAKVLDESEHEVANVGSLQKAVLRIKEQFHNLPYFISTGQPDLLSDDMFRSFFPDYYEKHTDDEKLCMDIVKAIEETPNRQIVNKYPELFTKLSTPIYEEMISIIKIHENHETNNADAFNKIRKVLDWIMQSVSDYGLLAAPFNGTNLNDCSKFLGNTKLNEYIPTYIQRHLFSLVTIANDGSHRQVTDEFVKNGNAPYLVSATIFELINVLVWFHNLPQDQESKDRIERLVSNIAYDMSNHK
ncbi:MAG: hypothetical protein Q4A15_03395 [Prevotellaceae bacterium]|nr:hypothetical protein [Prevotellaceae bacterium]